MPFRFSRLIASKASAAAITTVLCIPGIAFALDETDNEKALGMANARALPDTYRIALTYEEGGESLEFSTVTAMRHFSLAPPERRIRFRGRLWLQEDGRELLDFSVELGQQIAQVGSDEVVSRDGNWAGSTYVEPGRPIKIVENPNSTITVTLERR